MQNSNIKMKSDSSKSKIGGTDGNRTVCSRSPNSGSVVHRNLHESSDIQPRFSPMTRPVNRRNRFARCRRSGRRSGTTSRCECVPCSRGGTWFSSQYPPRCFDQTSLLFQECLARIYLWRGIQGAYKKSTLSLCPSQISYVNEFRV